MKLRIILLCMVLPLSALAMAESNDQIAPLPTDVSINGLHFDDVSGYGGIDETALTGNGRGIRTGRFEFKILGYSEPMSEGIEKLKLDSRFHVPLRDVAYYNISEITVDGWPAVVGVMKRMYGVNPDFVISGYIYVGDYKIGFNYLGDWKIGGFSNDYRVENALDALQNIRITPVPEMNLSLYSSYHLEPYEDCDSCSPTIIPLNLSRGGLYVAPGDFSVIGQNSEQPNADDPVAWSNNYLHIGELEMIFQHNDSKGMEAAKTELTDLIKSEVLSPSDITYLNVSETMIGGWPAIVGIMNSSRHYASGPSDPPVIYLKALIYAKDTKILAEMNEVQQSRGWYELMGERQPSEEKLLDMMRSIKITLAPGASWW